MDNFRVDKDATLNAFEFYERHKTDRKFYNLFEEDSSDEEIQVTKQKVDPRPTTPINVAIKKPPKDHGEITKCFRERLRLTNDSKYVSTEDQNQLADVLTMAIISVWPAHRKQGADPFLNDSGNVELQRRVAVYVIETVENLFYHYTAKAEEMNKRAIFSAEANISRLKTQLLQEANDSLDILKVRRKLAEKMREIADDDWLEQQPIGTDLVSMLSSIKGVDDAETKVLVERSYQLFIQKQVSEMNGTLASNSSTWFPPKELISVLKSIEERKTTNENNQQSTTATVDDKAVPAVERVANQNIGKDVKIFHRFDSMPDLQADSEYVEEFQTAKDCIPERRQSVSQLIIKNTVKAKELAEQNLSLYDDVHKLVHDKMKKEKVVAKDEVSPLLQSNFSIEKRKKPSYNILMNNSKIAMEESMSTVQSVSNQSSAFTDISSNNSELNGVSIQGDQPNIINVNIPGTGIVQICDAQICNKLKETELILKKFPTSFNELIGEITEEEAKELDAHLFAGVEIQDVYDEITKTISKDHLEFDKDDCVEHCALETFRPKEDLYLSNMLQSKMNKKLINTNLMKELQPPWHEFDTADKWRNEPKFAGMGREDILKINSTLSHAGGKLSRHRISSAMQQDKMSTTTIGGGVSGGGAGGGVGKLAKSYSAWMSWYKTNINTDDYKKFISRKDTDFLAQIFHMYESENESDEEEERNRRKTSADIAKLKEHQRKKEELWRSKVRYQNGYWNAQCVSLGGLGREPSLTDFDVDEEIRNTVESDAVEEVSPYILLQDRFETLWQILKMTNQMKVDMTMKYSSKKSLHEITEVLEHMEQAAELIVEREALLTKLEAFEKFASDPNRFFEKGPNGLSIARLNESTTREKN